jgi:glycosyltransferase involved in cell wall biosynthesis
MKRWRLAVVVSHPIQYQAPWFRALAEVTDLTVFFCHRQQPGDHAKADFGVSFEWDTPLLEGYGFRWLENRSRHPDVSTFRGCDTPEIADRLSRGGFDACVVSGWYLKSYVQAIRGCRASAIPVLLRGDSQLGTSRSTVVSIAKYFPYRWLLQHVDGHLYVGEANRDYLRYYGVADSKLFFVPHCVDNAFFSAAASDAKQSGEAARIRLAAGAGPSDTVFIFVGKLVAKKRPADFLRALEMAHTRGADVRGLIVGSGRLESDLRSLAREQSVPVSFAGFKNQIALPSYLAAADALVLPSDAGETWGLVVNEAMACGLPAIVSRAAGCTRDLIEQGRTGYAFDLGSVSQLSDAILATCARRADSATTFSEAVKARIDRYSVEAAVSATVTAISATVARTRSADHRIKSPSAARHSRAGASFDRISHD